jgi:hypothetical protein
MDKRVNDKTNRKFGHLLVVGFSHSIKWRTKKGKLNSRSMWTCRCDCGNIVTVRSDGLSTGNSTQCNDCGMKARKAALKKACEKTKKPKGEAYLTMLYGRCKRRAKSLNIEFSLTRGQYKGIITQDCVYCNSLPQPANSKLAEKYNGSFYHNGVDRVDNTKGYFIGNCVSCCSICNKMKLDYTIEFWTTHISKILENLKK